VCRVRGHDRTSLAVFTTYHRKSMIARAARAIQRDSFSLPGSYACRPFRFGQPPVLLPFASSPLLPSDAERSDVEAARATSEERRKVQPCGFSIN